MATQNKTKLKILLNNIKPESVALAPWLEDAGISRNLQKHYRNSGWLGTVGRGAFKRPGDTIHWQGAIHALQYQAGLNIHIGALTALTLQGFGHYFRFDNEKVFIFALRKTKLPKWFLTYDWGDPIYPYQTTFLPSDIGVVQYEEKNFPIKISSPERAILECLYLTPETIDIVECFHLMQGLVNIKPKLVQRLLQKCSSVKVKRLFLYLAEKANHDWFHFLEVSTINLGTGNRVISKGGAYIAKYQISVPKELSGL
jgi:hypothetical protein